jgi:imidazolonepropionase-like amidohydrolase
MSLKRFVACAFIFVLASALAAGAQRSSSAALWFEGARLIVGDGSAPIENGAFLVEGETFAWVGRQGQRQPRQGATRVDLAGKTVMPALIDGHNHIGLVNEKDGSNSKANYRRENLVDQLQRYAYYGTAATMSMGLEADQELAYELRDQVIPNAARFLTVGQGHRRDADRRPARRTAPGNSVRRANGRRRDAITSGTLHARGVHFVKIWVDDRNGDVPKLQPAVYRAIIAEAHANGMEVLAHLSRTTALADAKDLLEAGVDGFVHLVRDRDVDEQYLASVKAHPKVWSGPNMPVPSNAQHDRRTRATLPASQIDTMRKQLAQLEATGNPPNELFELHCRNLRKIHDAGMVIGLGTDGTGDGFGAHEQIEAYTRCGMTPMEAIVAGTGTNARILHLDRMGTIAAGKEASFNVLDANPLESITNTRRISTIYLRGKGTRSPGAPGPALGQRGTELNGAVVGVPGPCRLGRQDPRRRGPTCTSRLTTTLARAGTAPAARSASTRYIRRPSSVAARCLPRAAALPTCPRRGGPRRAQSPPPRPIVRTAEGSCRSRCPRPALPPQTSTRRPWRATP